MDLKAKVLARMNQARKVAICVDIWSKKGLTASFLGVTVHFFTPQDHKWHRVTLAVRRLASPHTADHVEANEMLKTFTSTYYNLFNAKYAGMEH